MTETNNVNEIFENRWYLELLLRKCRKNSTRDFKFKTLIHFRTADIE